MGVRRTSPGHSLTPGPCHNSRETSSGSGRGAVLPSSALVSTSPPWPGVLPLPSRCLFIPSGSDSSLGGMHRADGPLAPLPGLQGWGGGRCGPDLASSGMATLRALPCPSLISPEAGEVDRNSLHSSERRLTFTQGAGCHSFWAGNSGMPPTPQVSHTVGTWSICEGHCS